MEKAIKIKKVKRAEENVVAANFASDYFKCGSCGYTVRMKILGNYATCSQCGGRMSRC